MRWLIRQLREKDSVEVHPRITKRMDDFLQKVTRLEVVGDFHSHPEEPVDKVSSVRLSNPDKKSMMVNNLGIVIAVDKDEEKEYGNIFLKGP